MAGTYYIAGGLTRPDGHRPAILSCADIRGLIEAGHEIGSHGYGHLNYQLLSKQRAVSDIESNDRFLVDEFNGLQVSGFSYPFGGVSPRVRRWIGARFSYARGIRGGINTGMMDVSLLRAVRLYSARNEESKVRQLIADCSHRRGWIILYTHDVDHSPTEVGCTPELLKNAVKWGIEEGLEILPVKSALARAAFRPLPD